MQTNVYAVDDHEVLEAYFGDEPVTAPIANLGLDHGELIWSGKCELHPQEGDLVLIDGDEYVVVARFYDLTKGETSIIVTPRLVGEVTLS